MPLRSKALISMTIAAVFLQIASASAQNQRNLILFVPDGLRPLSVTPATTPAIAAVRDKGVNFANPHALFPTFTMANASGMATGHFLGDTGAFSNTIYTAYPVPTARGSVTPFIEHDLILGDVDAHFSGNFVDEDTILFAARRQGFSTAAIGKLGPTLMFDHTERTGEATVIIDESTGSKQGSPLSQAMQDALKAAGLPLVAPSRKDTPGDNSNAGNFEKAGTLVANVVQQKYFADVAIKVVLPMFKARNRPFLLMFWSRDPDGTQHNQGDSHLRVTPGINGPTSLASIKNADDNLAQLRRALDDLGLAATTDIVIAADHGFSTISKESNTSPAAKARYADVPVGLLPPGFLAIDLARALDLPLSDPDDKNKLVEAGKHSSRGNGLIGNDSEKPEVVVAANGGSDLVYVPNKDSALTGATDCGQPLMCAVSIADTILQQGQGMHGSFSRADTMNFMAAIGPSFKTVFVDEAPVSNADIGKTIAYALGLKIPFNGFLQGRVLKEALLGGASPAVERWVERGEPSENGLATILVGQRVGQVRYFDAAGFPGRTVGMDDRKAASR